MYVIIAYDIGVERLDSVRQTLKQYLNWIQNSAFEGELSEGRLEEVRLKVMELIDEKVDSVVVFTVSNPEWVRKFIWGREKGATDEII
jgi:CRISPR-associated protein Cas2